MRVAVITPYYKESNELLEQCRASVVDQTVACDHVFVADGFPNEVVERWRVKHFILPNAHGDAGNMARVIGSLSVFAQGYDAVAFLDADNWYRSDHIQRLLDLHCRTGAAVCTTRRSMHRADGSYMFDDAKSDGRTHVDTNCLFLTRPSLPIIARWAHMPRELYPVGDSVYWSSIRSSRLSHAHEPAVTVCYRTTWEADYKRMGEAAPAGSKTLAFTDRPYYWFKSLPARERWRIWQDFGFPLRRRTVAKLVGQYALSRLSPYSYVGTKHEY
ncbi:glycosyltransferase [Rhizobium phaseoli]|uniref:glycosyltransferase n=1 Tax=Rhizobium phaseoli TaxID=396 RepID=UPI000F86BF20|nr:glycosyltransferase [Rhizobium phaseoli]RUM22851.1 glycosyltransferase [Rhizobium phaseoli]